MRSQLDRFCDEHNIKAECVYGGNVPGSHPWRVTLRRRSNGERRQLSVDFFQGPAICAEPTPADVLSCLLSDASSVDNCCDFEEWAEDYGFLDDFDEGALRRARRVWDACEALQLKLERFLGCDLYDRAIVCDH